LGAGQDGHAKNTPQGGITTNPNEGKFSSLPLSLIPPGIGDQGDLNPYISNPTLHDPTKIHGDQAFLDTATLLSSISASLALAPLGRSLIMGAGHDGHAKNTSRGDITNDPNDDKYSSLPLSLVPLFIGNQGDLDAYISNPALCQPTKIAFCGGQASLITAALLTSTSAPPARISIYTNKRSALAFAAKGGVSICRNIENAPQRSLEAPLEQVIKDRKSTYFARKWHSTAQWMNRISFGKPRKNLGGYSWLLMIDLLTKKMQANTIKVNACASCMKI
jgi:hypothetical protein